MDKQLPQFEATHENIMSIINMLTAYEMSTKKTKADVIKKYTKFSCGDLAALIKTLIPNSQVVLSLILKHDEIENLAYHFMIKVKPAQNPEREVYYDINGKHEREGLEEYVATILERDPKSEVGFTTKTKQNRPIENSNTVAKHCLDDIATYPNMIASGMFNKEASRK